MADDSTNASNQRKDFCRRAIGKQSDDDDGNGPFAAIQK